MDELGLLFVTGSLTDGGAEKVMSILASGCADLGIDVTLIILRKRKVVYRVSDNVKLIQIGEPKHFIIVHRILELHRILKKSKGKVIIPFLPIISIYTMLANIGVGNKVIMSERADPSVSVAGMRWKDKIGNTFARRLGMYKRADWMVFQTPEAQLYYSEAIQKKSSIIPNPLDSSNLPECYDGMREKRIVAAGRFTDQKNFELLIEAFAEFQKNNLEYSLEIYGDGERRSCYEELIRQYGIEDKVILPGFVSDLPNRMVKAAMYVSTSNYEGISNVMLEALGMGIPTIATDCPVGGSKLYVRTDSTGILIKMNDKEGLIQAMNKIASDENYSKGISIEARKIRDELEVTNICKRWLYIAEKIRDK